MATLTPLRRNWLRIAFWTASVAAIVAILLWYRAEVRGPEAPGPVRKENAAPPASGAAVVLYVGARPAGESFAQSELAAINSAATAWKRAGEGAWIAVISPEKKRGLCAKVILHSHGVGPGRVRVAGDADDLPWKRATCAVLVLPLPESAAAVIRDAGVVTSTAPRVEFKALPAPGKVKRAAVVLGNEPLDGSTPTVDLVKRALKGVEHYAARRGTLLVFTGGPTAGGLSEARMMALVAASRGVPEEGFRLEEGAESTRQNAELTAKMLAPMKLEKVTVITKQSHMKSAMAMFRRRPEFKSAEPLACEVTREEILAHMRAYLEVFESPRVRARMEALAAGRAGPD